MKYIISKIAFWLIGWKVVAPKEIMKKARNTVTVAAPHTSNFDTFLALAAFWQMKLPMKFLIKDFYTKWYFFGLFTQDVFEQLIKYRVQLFFELIFYAI